MTRWTATVRVAGQTLEVSIHLDGRVDPDLLEILREEEISHGRTVDLTATGPTVPITVDDATATIAWIRETFEIVEYEQPDDWPDDPRLEIPDGAVS